ncbi:hypothetical protein JCM10908_003389 [Rhodotorula pacifica]|uniref:Frag1/DRAM/Sfk1 family protein n=1 Tax=Rhodotorula pacifica TaxID=1495444 RepID=UPI00316D0E5D
MGSAVNPAYTMSAPAKSSSWDPTSLQDDLDAHPPPPVSRTSTVIIRALPTLATASWLTTLTALLVSWAVEGHQVYSSTSGAVPYLSDVAYHHRSIFLAGCCATASFYVSSLSTERSLRATRILPEVTTDRKLWHMVGVADVFTGGCAAMALVAMSVYDIVHAPNAHIGFAICFIVFLDLSGLLQTVEVSHLWHEHPDRHDLRDGCLLKWLIMAIASACGIAFAALHYRCGGDAFAEPVESCYRTITAAAILQWIACYGWGAYLSTLIIDLWPVHRHTVRALPPMQADARGGIHGVWLPSGTARSSAPYGYQPIPPHMEVERYPPAQGPEDTSPCGVRLVPRRGFSTGFRDDVQGREWYEAGKRSAGRRR